MSIKYHKNNDRDIKNIDIKIISRRSKISKKIYFFEKKSKKLQINKNKIKHRLLEFSCEENSLSLF